MDINAIRQRRNELEEDIEQLIKTFQDETEVDISAVSLQPTVYAYDAQGNIQQEITSLKVEVELII